MTVYELTVYDDSGADTRTESDHDKVFHTSGRAIGHLAYSGGIGIVGNGHRDSELIAHHLSQWQRRWPGNIYKFLYHPGIIVRIRGTYADTMHFANSIIGLEQTHYIVIQLIYIIIDISMLECLDRRTCYHYATGVNDTEYSVGTAYIDT